MRDRALGSTIRMQFVSTNPDGGGAPVAPSSAFAAADIRIYKDGSASEKTTTNGITVTSPFDSITGLHLVEIDTSNSTGDSGFWASGSVYHVRLVTAKTVATYSVSGLLIGEFSLELQTARLAAITHTGAIVPRVTLVDTCTTNTDMRGTDNAALAATALNTAVWTSTIAGRIDATISSRSTYAGGDTAGTTTLLSRIGSAITITGGAVTAVLDSSARVKLHGTQDDYAPLKASDYTAPLNAASTRTALGMAAADLDIQLDAILAAASAGAGTGARTVTITVNDGTTVLQNAVVRFTEGSNTYRAITNASGVATFNLDDATYTVAVSKVGYYYAGTTMVVNGTETATYSMTAVNVTPGAGDLTTGYLTCLDEEGSAEEGVSVRCQVVQVPASGTGFAYDSAVQLATSDADGLVEFPMVKGARYLVWRGSIKPPQGITPILISASAGSTTALGSLIGD